MSWFGKTDEASGTLNEPVLLTVRGSNTGYEGEDKRIDLTAGSVIVTSYKKVYKTNWSIIPKSLEVDHLKIDKVKTIPRSAITNVMWTDKATITIFYGKSSESESIRSKSPITKENVEFQRLFEELNGKKDTSDALDEPALYTIKPDNFPLNQIELTATTLLVTSIEEKDKSLLSTEKIRVIDSVRKIPRSEITKAELKVSKPGIFGGICVMNIFRGKPKEIITFSYYSLDKYELLFKQIDEENYKIYLEEKAQEEKKDDEKAKKNLPWYLDSTKLNHIATYSNAEEATQEANAASHAGWLPSGTSATDGHINVGRTATEAVLTGGLTLLLGASRTKGNVTVTYVRTPQWLEEHNMAPKKPEVPTTTTPSDVITQLERLAKLKDQGVLSEEEFQAQKNKVLGA